MPSREKITLENVHKLSLYELRQELTNCEAWTPTQDDEITYRASLEKMVSLLMKEKEEELEARQRRQREVNDRQGDSFNKEESLQERLRRQKEERKKAALERSQARQSRPDYFDQKANANTLKPHTSGTGGVTAEGGGGPRIVQEINNIDAEDEIESQEDNTNDDPFRMDGRRQKIFVR